MVPIFKGNEEKGQMEGAWEESLNRIGIDVRMRIQGKKAKQKHQKEKEKVTEDW